MKHIIECKKEGQTNKNTGAKEQCIAAPVVRHCLATNEQEFATVADFKDLAVWKTDRDSKDLIPLYPLEELSIADTEDTYKEGNEKYRTAIGQKIRKFNCVLSECSHAALKSYHGKILRVYEFTKEQEIKGITIDGTKVKGQTVKIEVGKLVDAVNDNYQYSPVTLYYQDYNEYEEGAVRVKPDWPNLEIEGIFDVQLELVGTPTASSIKFKASAGCVGDVVKSLISENVTVKTAGGSAITHSFLTADADGVYELTSTAAFANGDVIDLNGIVVKTEATYESTGPVTVTGIA